MIIKESKYDKYGWKIIVKKSKEGYYHIYYRSKFGHHKIHKPFYLRLQSKDMQILKKLLKEVESSHKNNANVSEEKHGK